MAHLEVKSLWAYCRMGMVFPRKLGNLSVVKNVQAYYQVAFKCTVTDDCIIMMIPLWSMCLDRRTMKPTPSFWLRKREVKSDLAKAA
eukprot:336025-Pelagomonas_calceolata.AAC.9